MKFLQHIYICVVSVVLFSIAFPCKGQIDQKVLLEKIEQSSNSHERFKLFSQLARLNKYTNTEKGIFYAERAANIAKESGSVEEQIQARIFLASCKLIGGNSIDAIQTHLNTLSEYEVEDSLKVDIYNLLGLSFQILSEPQLAKEYAEKAVAIADSINTPRLALRSYGNLGKVHLDLKKYDQSLSYFLKAKEMAISVKDSIQLCYIKKDLAELYLLRNELANAKQSAKEAIQLGISKNYGFIESEARTNLSNILREELNYTASIMEAKKAIRILEEVNAYPSTIKAIESLIKTKIELQELDEALILSFSKLKDTKLEEFPDLDMNLNLLVSKIYKQKKDYKNALFYSEQANELKEKLNEKNNFQSAELTQRMLSSQKIMIENQLLKKQIRTNQDNTRRSNAFGITMAFFSFILLGLVAILYRVVRKTDIFKNLSNTEQELELRFQFVKSVSLLAFVINIPLLLNLYFFKVFWGTIIALCSTILSIVIYYLTRFKKSNLIFGLLIISYIPPLLFLFALGPLKGLLVTSIVLFLIIYFFKPEPIYQIINTFFAISFAILYFLIIKNFPLQSHPFPNDFDTILTIGNFLLILIVLFYFSKNINDFKNLLIQNNNFLSQLADTNPHFIYTKNKNRAFTFVNEVMGKTFGVSKEDLIGEKDEDVFEKYHPKSVNNFHQDKDQLKIDDLKVLTQGKQIKEKIEKIYTQEGNEMWLMTTKKPLFSKDNKVVGLFGVGIDITETKLANEKLQESENRYRQLFNMSFDGLLIINKNGKILDANASAKKLFHLVEVQTFDSKFILNYIPSFHNVINLSDFFDDNHTYFHPVRVNGISQKKGVIPLEVSLFKIPYNGKMEIACVFKNISAQLILEKKEQELVQQKQELDTLNNEVVSQVIFANTKNKLLSEIHVDLKSIIRSTVGKNKQDLIKLKRKIEANIDDEDNFYSFRLKFEKSHPDFFQNLKTIQPKLTKNDLKICAYMRLGMTISDIANLLFIEKKSVEMSKYRLKKKLDLSPEEDLNDFILNI